MDRLAECKSGMKKKKSSRPEAEKNILKQGIEANLSSIYFSLKPFQEL